MPGEEWRPIAGFEGLYEVSSFGRVRSLFGGRIRILKPRPTPRGYLRVYLTARCERYVHHLVAEAFIGPRPLGCTVNHRDADKANNAAPNLEYLSEQDHRDHTKRMLLYARGSKAGPAKLTEEHVVQIRRMKGRMLQREIAALFGVSQTVVHHIHAGKTWKHVP